MMNFICIRIGTSVHLGLELKMAIYKNEDIILIHVNTDSKHSSKACNDKSFVNSHHVS